MSFEESELKFSTNRQRRRKRQHDEIGTAADHQFSDDESRYRSTVYFATLDNVVA
jgi:hypothetical protein